MLYCKTLLLNYLPIVPSYRNQSFCGRQCALARLMMNAELAAKNLTKSHPHCIYRWPSIGANKISAKWLQDCQAFIQSMLNIYAFSASLCWEILKMKWSVTCSAHAFYLPSQVSCVFSLILYWWHANIINPHFLWKKMLSSTPFCPPQFPPTAILMSKGKCWSKGHSSTFLCEFLKDYCLLST